MAVFVRVFHAIFKNIYTGLSKSQVNLALTVNGSENKAFETTRS